MAEMFYSAFVLIFALYGAVCLSRRLYFHFLLPKGKRPFYILAPLRGEGCEQSLRAALALAKEGEAGRLTGVVAMDAGLDAQGRQIVERMQTAGEPLLLLEAEELPVRLTEKLKEFLE